MAVINIPANNNGATTTQNVVIKVSADYTGPLSAPLTVHPIMRVSPIFDFPGTPDAFGRPVSDGKLQLLDEIVEPWGRLVVFVGGKDITYYRGAATKISTLSWQRLGNFETANFEIPAITVYDRLGEGELSWLKDSALVNVVKVAPDNSMETIWLGTINAISPTAENIGVSITAHGLIFDATYKVAKAPVRASDAERQEDIGTDIARTLNATQGLWSAVKPVSTGVIATKEPAWESSLEYVKSLLSLAVTDAGKSWTVWIDEARRASICQVQNIPNRKTFTLVAGQDGVEDNLAIDTVSGVTTIYGHGVTSSGVAWQNTRYPYAVGSIVRYPMDDPDEAFGEGSTDASTVTYTGVSDLQTRLAALGYTVTVNGQYDEATTTAVTAFQNSRNIAATGSVNDITWSRLFNISDIAAGAYQAPLATIAAVQPRLQHPTTGADLGPNPNYDPSIRPLEQHVDFGEGVSLGQAKRYAAGIIARDGNRPIEGDLVLTVCPQEISRFDIIPGDTVHFSNYHSESLDLLVHRVEWNMSDGISVSLKVSTRDMDYSELDAAMNRIRQSNIGLSRGARTETPKSTTAGVGYQPIPTVSPGAPVSTGGGVVGGIKEVKTTNNGVSVTSADADVLYYITPDMNSVGVILNSDSGIPNGMQVHFTQGVSSAGNTVTFAAGAGVSILSYNGNKLAADYASATAIKLNNTTWLLVGALML